MRLPSVVCLAILPAFAQISGTADRYPAARAIILEAEKAAVGIQFSDDRRNPHEWAASLYLRAGRFDDAVRAYNRSPGRISGPMPGLWQAQVLYGDLPGAEKRLLAIPDPGERADALNTLGYLLWRMGEPDQARLRFEAARRLAPKIVDLRKRQRILTDSQRGIDALKDAPPRRLSATPAPRERLDPQESPLPPFPITTDGFRYLDPKEVTARAAANGEFLTALYARMQARDREGLARLAESAASPFQKALALASIEHILIQVGRPEIAEEYARMMPEVDSDCSLAKAEALAAAAAAWLRAGDLGRARADFDSAVTLLQSVPDLTVGRVSILVSIAASQFKGGLAVDSRASLQLAKELALKAPVRPERPKSRVWRQDPPGVYRDEAYSKILECAIRIEEMSLAREIAALLGGPGATNDSGNHDVLTAWLDAGLVDEALAFTRSSADVRERVRMLLIVAREMLDTAGAPDI